MCRTGSSSNLYILLITFLVKHIDYFHYPTGSTECPNVDTAQLLFQEDVNCKKIPSSTSRQVEQLCAEVTCEEAQQVPFHRPLLYTKTGIIMYYTLLL
jgi:hypothetical protein